MDCINIEIKARCEDHEKIRNILKSLNADFKGVDNQVDTYFDITNKAYGPILKLRQGQIENNTLIYYDREPKQDPKLSKIILYKFDQNSQLKEILINSLQVSGIIKKTREIYFIDNVKFHLDTVKDLGEFVEIEAQDLTGKIGKFKLDKQCKYYMNLFEIKKEDLIDCSYYEM